VKEIFLRTNPSSSLPRDPFFSRQPSAFSQDDVSGAGKQPARDGSILIVEDDFLIAAQMEATLKDAGFEIAGVAVSAAEALECASSQHPILCVMDIRLSGDRDGIEAAIELLRVHSIRCIFATAHSDNDVRRRAAAANPLGWLQKPYTMSSLTALVRRAVHDLHDNAS
jgi:two-component system, response regulator PdtaR